MYYTCIYICKLYFNSEGNWSKKKKLKSIFLNLTINTIQGVWYNLTPNLSKPNSKSHVEDL